MFKSLRGDVSCAKAVIKAYKAWIPPDPSFPKSEQLSAFCDDYLVARFSAPIGSPEKRQMMYALAQIALPEYIAEINHDESPSILALVGAICEAERVIADPSIIAQQCQKLLGYEIQGKTFGGVGIPNIGVAFQRASVRFEEARAAIERGLY